MGSAGMGFVLCGVDACLVGRDRFGVGLEGMSDVSGGGPLFVRERLHCRKWKRGGERTTLVNSILNVEGCQFEVVR